jgi:hypothetical protein
MRFRAQITLLFLVLVAAFTSIAVFTSVSFLKIKKFSEIDKMVYQLYNHSLEMKKNEGDYFKWE